jgi:hypothetical protein
MKKAIAVILMLAITNVWAETPLDKFSAEQNKVTKTTITWIPVDDLRKTCEEQSRLRGFSGFGVPMQACAFWNNSITGNSCVIYTPKIVDYWMIGHEMRHCYQGSFHK